MLDFTVMLMPTMQYTTNNTTSHHIVIAAMLPVPDATPAVCQHLLQGVAGDARGSVSFLFHPVPIKMQMALGQTTTSAVCQCLLQGVAGNMQGSVSFLFCSVFTKIQTALGQTRNAISTPHWPQ
jgi:hypothetical protein